MYYLRTMAASAPIQFTVDQIALQQADTAVAVKPVKKRAARPVPAPMMEEKLARTDGTEGEESSGDDQHVGKLAVVGNPSPKSNPKSNGIAGKKTRGEMEDIERGIFDSAVIACSIKVNFHC